MKPAQADLLAQTAARIRDMQTSGERLIVAVAGPPGAGKSTIAENLAALLEDAAVLPMDGFHFDNETLRARNLLHRKGAPNTFDTAGLIALLVQVRGGGVARIPTFDRATDQVVQGGGEIRAEDQIIVAEGNYLLLDQPGWREALPFWDFTIALQVNEKELERRLVQRWLDHGLSPQEAAARAASNDLLNARTVQAYSVEADVTLPNG